MQLIYSLTEDLTQLKMFGMKVRTFTNMSFIDSYQTLTEYGICYTTNNMLAFNLSTALLMENRIQTEDPLYKNSKLNGLKAGNMFDVDSTSSYSFIGFSSAISFYLHSPYETMNIAQGFDSTNDTYEFETFSTEIIATKKFREDTPISQRGCRFNTESNLTHFKVYSKLLCLSECRLDAAMKLCGCIPHFYPNNSTNIFDFNI